jgi:hypothetical protein
MADPEIARRCRFCGAAIRVRGFFCPQCGRPTSEPTSDESGDERATETEEVFEAPKTVSMDLSGLPTADLFNPQSAGDAATVPLRPPNTPELTAFEEQPAAKLADTVAIRAPHRTQPEDASRSRQMRETLGDVKKGFDKVREISTVMLDEASYDPSARFVLVAAILFILFLVILILSEMMR